MTVEGQYPGKMVGSSDPDAEVAVTSTKATSQRKHPSDRKREKTAEEKKAHNARCVQSRQKKKMRVEELEKAETQYIEMVPKFEQMRAENEKMKTELEEQNSKIRFMESENQQLRRALQNQVANKAQMELIPTGWKINEQNFSCFAEAVEWFASQTYDFEQVVQGAGTSHTNMTDFAAGFSVANALPSGLDPSIYHLNDNLFLHDSVAGGLTNSGAGSSGANNGLAIDAPNNHAHHSDQFTHDPAAGSQFGENPSSKAV
ncbi:hypothetical protein PTKIN_Ptkin04bG0170500 [Pterospermum kingtungense]